MKWEDRRPNTLSPRAKPQPAKGVPGIFPRPRKSDMRTTSMYPHLLQTTAMLAPTATPCQDGDLCVSRGRMAATF